MGNNLNKASIWENVKRHIDIVIDVSRQGGLEIDIFKNRGQDTFMGSLELDIDYVYFQPPHMAIMPMSNPLIRQLCLFQNLVFWMKKNAMKILIYDYIHMC